MNSRLMLSGVAAATMLLGSLAAHAADLRRPAPRPVVAARVPVVVETWSWTGFYFGAHGGVTTAGVDWSQLDSLATSVISNTPAGTTLVTDPSGTVFGAQLGGNSSGATGCLGQKFPTARRPCRPSRTFRFRVNSTMYSASGFAI